MARKMRLILCLGLVLAIGAACAAVQRQKGVTTETIKPSGIHEDCFEMTTGQILDYSFEATQRVDFNIHFHEDSGITYPIEKKGVSNDHGSFTPQKKQFYCLMWTNFQHEFVTLNYSYGVR